VERIAVVAFAANLLLVTAALPDAALELRAAVWHRDLVAGEPNTVHLIDGFSTPVSQRGYGAITNVNIRRELMVLDQSPATWRAELTAHECGHCMNQRDYEGIYPGWSGHEGHRNHAPPTGSDGCLMVYNCPINDWVDPQRDPNNDFSNGIALFGASPADPVPYLDLHNPVGGMQFPQGPPEGISEHVDPL